MRFELVSDDRHESCLSFSFLSKSFFLRGVRGYPKAWWFDERLRRKKFLSGKKIIKNLNYEKRFLQVIANSELYWSVMQKPVRVFYAEKLSARESKIIILKFCLIIMNYMICNSFLLLIATSIDNSEIIYSLIHLTHNRSVSLAQSNSFRTWASMEQRIRKRYVWDNLDCRI